MNIRNVLIEKCTINCDNSPCIYITNAASELQENKYKKLRLRNLIIKDCEFHAPKYEMKSQNHPSIIRIGGVDGDSIFVRKVRGFANKDSMTYFLNILDYSEIGKLTIDKCSLEGKNVIGFVRVGKSRNSDTIVDDLTLRDCVCNLSDRKMIENNGNIRKRTIQQ